MGVGQSLAYAGLIELQTDEHERAAVVQEQVHGMDADEFFTGEGYIEVACELVPQRSTTRLDRRQRWR